MYPSRQPHPQTELLLAASSQLLKHSREKIFIKDKDLIYRAASQKFVTMAGWEKESDIIGKTDFEIFEDQELAMGYREDDKRLIERQTDLTDFVEPLTEKDGKPRYASTSKFLLRDSNGEFMGLLGVSRDITIEYYLQRNRVRKLEYLFALPQDIYFAVYLDVDEWRIISERHQEIHGQEYTFHSTIESLVQYTTDHLADSNTPVRDFYQNFNQKALTELYRSGTHETVFEYRRYMTPTEARWVRTEACFLEDVISGHLCVMLVIRDIQQRKADEEERVRLADRDELTGLLNRKATMQLIRDRLADSAPGEKHALFMIDADYFKDVNNTYGHQAGDQALADFAKAISATFRTTDIIGRIGGDEFFVLMTNVPDRAVVETKAKALLNALRAVHYNEIHLSASIGITFYPDEATVLEDMYALSDSAMYAVKDRGRNGICFAADMTAAHH